MSAKTRTLSKLKIQNSQEKFIIQPNEISRAIYVFNSLTKKKVCHLAGVKKIFCSVIHQFKTEKNKANNRQFIFNLKDLAKELNFSKVQRMIPILDELADLKLKLKLKKAGEISNYQIFNFISNCEFDSEKNFIKIVITNEMAEILNCDMSKNFTLYQLKEIASLSNFYSMRIYELLMSWRGIKGKFKKFDSEWYKKNITDYKNTWYIEYNIEELKEIFQLSDVRTNCFVERYLIKPVELLNKELSNYVFKIQIIRKFDRIINGENRGEIEKIFVWITEKFDNEEERERLAIEEEKLFHTEPLLIPSAENERMKALQEYQADQEKIRRMKNIHPDEFSKRYEEHCKNRKPWDFDFLMEAEICLSMLKDGFSI